MAHCPVLCLEGYGMSLGLFTYTMYILSMVMVGTASRADNSLGLHWRMDT